MPTFKIDQSKDHFVTEIREGSFLLRYAYARSQDSRLNSENGQDFFTWQVDADKLVFALCDGVSKSFYGEIGAQILGNNLVRWLWGSEFDENSTSDQKSQQLGHFLNSIANTAESIIDKVDLMRIDNEFVRTALFSRREQAGTQSNFVCGVIQRPGKKYPNGNIDLFWLGDAKLKIFQEMNNYSDQLCATWNSEEGWSSKDGIVGEIHHFHGTWNDIDGIIAHSDGLDQISGILSPNLHSAELDRLINEQDKIPESDDISFLEILIDSPFVGKTPVPPDSQKKPAIALVMVLLLVVIALPVLYLLREYLKPPIPPEDLMSTSQTIPVPSETLSTTEMITRAVTQTPIISQVVITEEFPPTLSTPFSDFVVTREVRLVSESLNFSLLTGCNNISSFHSFDSVSGQLFINGSFFVKAYNTKDCYGEPTFVFYEWNTDEQLLGDIQSLFVDELPFQ